MYFLQNYSLPWKHVKFAIAEVTSFLRDFKVLELADYAHWYAVCSLSSYSILVGLHVKTHSVLGLF